MTYRYNYFIKAKDQNKLRRQICYVNWRYHKSDLIERLNAIASGFNENEFLIGVYDDKQKNEPYVEGNDSIVVRFFVQSTAIRYHEKCSITNDFETGATLVISHSDVGFDTVFIHPAKSKQSGADHKTLIVYHNQHGAKISDSKLNKLINSLCLYHVYTSVLFETSLLMRFRVSLLRLKSFYYSYLDKENKFKYSSGIYIPLASLVVSFIALLVSYIALKHP